MFHPFDLPHWERNSFFFQRNIPIFQSLGSLLSKLLTCKSRRENRTVSRAHVPLSQKFHTHFVFKKSNVKEETSEWGGEGWCFPGVRYSTYNPLTNSSSLPLHVTLPMAVLAWVHHTEKQWKFILAMKQGILLKLLLGKEMDQRVYIEVYHLSEHKFLSRSVMQTFSHGMEKVWYPISSISLRVTKGILPSKKGQENVVAWAS